MLKILQRLWCYLTEALFCLRAGRSVRDKLVLLQETAVFHLKHNRPGGRIDTEVRLSKLTPHLKMRTYGGDIFIFHEVLSAQVYRIDSACLLRSPRVIMDLGANIGLTTLLLAEQFPESRIVCVEPHPENAELLRHNLLCLGTRAQIIQAAVADRSGKMFLSFAVEHYNASLVRDGTEGTEVCVMTVEEVMKVAGVERIDILKMDIEGAEKLILPGRPKWLCEVEILLAELHGHGQDRMVEDMKAAGLVVNLNGSQVSAFRSRPESCN